jgi:hypothetical protein
MNEKESEREETNLMLIEFVHEESRQGAENMIKIIEWK